jgi:hypothetical protein
MGALQEIVDVNIVVQNSGISVAAFNKPMYLGLHKVFEERARTYASVAEMLEDGFDPNSQEVIVATAVFAQSISVDQLVIGRRHSDEVESITPSPVSNSAEYSITINGTEFSITSGGSATAAAIVDALVAAINGGSEPVTAVDNNTSLALVADVPGVDFTVTTSENLTTVVDDYSAESLTAAIAAVRALDDTWYAIMTHSHVEDDILEVAGVIEALDAAKIYAYSTADADVITSSTTDVMSLLQDLNYDRTFGLYDPDADSAFPEAAWVSDGLARDPGEATWMFKTLVGQDADAISTTQRGFVNTKNGNTYETIGGVAITREGKVASGEYIDVVIGIDWMTARITERVFGALVANPKIPYTQEGVTIIEAQLRAQLRDSVDAGIITEDFDVEVPTVSEIASSVKATRQLPEITFTGTLQGAIHKVTINGTVTV